MEKEDEDGAVSWFQHHIGDQPPLSIHHTPISLSKQKEAEQEGEETAAITAPAATGAGEHLSANPLEATDAKQGGKEEEMELSAAGRGGKAKDASKSAGEL